ncbi:MAG: NAD-dependent epimerase/dehydratase family protein [Candidatus Bathyarchaeota archaeon]|nr:NAD-dependent epimerase/dehydratase family protein [Candidatus Bathyarchaeota archaeon]
MNILVTGGSGFIGSHVVDKLVGEGHNVRVFDEYKPLRGDVEWFKGNLLNENDILEACKDMEIVYHLAAVADVNVALSHSALCLQINEIGTMNLLNAASSMEVERVILASTTWVYGRTEGVVDENTPLPPPDHIYTKTKIGQEHLLISWQKHTGLPYTILRYDIPYGPRMRANMAIAIFVRKAMQKETITVFGDGNQGRCFIHVDDLARGNVAALQPSASNQIFNLAGSEFVTINKIVEALREKFKNLKIEHAPPRPHDFKGAIVSIEKARQLLKWEPKISFKNGLKDFITYMQGQKSQ